MAAAPCPRPGVGRHKPNIRGQGPILAALQRGHWGTPILDLWSCVQLGWRGQAVEQPAQGVRQPGRGPRTGGALCEREPRGTGTFPVRELRQARAAVGRFTPSHPATGAPGRLSLPHDSRTFSGRRKVRDLGGTCSGRAPVSLNKFSRGSENTSAWECARSASACGSRQQSMWGRRESPQGRRGYGGAAAHPVPERASEPHSERQAGPTAHQFAAASPQSHPRPLPRPGWELTRPPRLTV